jgi:hypothetical protein
MDLSALSGGGGGNPMAMLSNLKGVAADLLDSDSLRSIYDKIMSNSDLSQALQGAAGENFKLLDTVVHILLPSKYIVYTGTIITLFIMLVGQAVTIYELYRILQFCNSNTNINLFITAVKVCLYLSLVMGGIELLIFIYMFRLGQGFSRAQMRYFCNWNVIFQIAQFGLIAAMSLAWSNAKNSSAFKASVISTPNVIPSISDSVSFTVSLNLLLTLVIGISWAYFCALDAIILPFVKEYGEMASGSMPF